MHTLKSVHDGVFTAYKKQKKENKMRYTIEIEDRQLAITILGYLGLAVKTTSSGISFHYDGKTIENDGMVVESIWDIIYQLNQSPARDEYTIKEDGVLCWMAYTIDGGGWANQGSSFRQVTEEIPTNTPNVTGAYKINGWINRDNSSQRWHWVFASSLEEAEKVLAQHLKPL